MKKIFLIYAFVATCLIFAQDKKNSPVGARYKSATPNIPYIYKNGYKDFEIVRVPTVTGKNTIYTGELRFNAVYSSFYTMELLFDAFGIWDKELRAKEDYTSILVWKKKKLFADSNRLYDIYARGKENKTEMYAAVMVFDDNKNDVLIDSSAERNKMVNYFAQGIKHLKSNRKFYKVYGKER